MRPCHWLLPRPWWLDAHRGCAAGEPGCDRHRRRQHPGRHRGRPGAEDDEEGQRRAVLLWRRSLQHRQLPRIAQHGGVVEAACRLHRREQPVRHVGPPDQGDCQTGHRRPRLRLRHPRRGGRRDGRHGCAQRGWQGGGTGAQGPGPIIGRVQDLPLVRPLALRSARLPHHGRRGRVEGSRSDPGLRQANAEGKGRHTGPSGRD
jgi:hypothetical protein